MTFHDHVAQVRGVERFETAIAPRSGTYVKTLCQFLEGATGVALLALAIKIALR